MRLFFYLKRWLPNRKKLLLWLSGLHHQSHSKISGGFFIYCTRLSFYFLIHKILALYFPHAMMQKIVLTNLIPHPMKTNKKDNKKQTLTPREVAKNFIRPYLDKGDTLSLHPSFKASVETEEYSVHILNEKELVVTKLYGTAINETFLITDIMKDIVMNEVSKKFEGTEDLSAKLEYAKISEEIVVLLGRLKSKLKGHKRQFLKNPKSWACVGDLAHIAGVLKEVV